MNREKQMKRKLALLVIALVAMFGLGLYNQLKKGMAPQGEKPQEKETVIENVWINESSKESVQVFFDGFFLDFTGDFEEVPQSGCIADIVIAGDQLVSVKVKNESIYGKVLAIDTNTVEIESYGVLELEESSRVFRTFGNLTQLDREDIQVGYEGAQFFVAEGKICGIIFNEQYVPESIRVLLKTTDYQDVYHDRVEITANSDFVITCGDEEKKYKSGEKIEITPGSELFSGSRIEIATAADDGEIEILTIERKQGNPSYLGALEIEETDEGLLLVNELSLEQYLYAVIPSEMPTSYDLEALKAQAVCARSYAYKQMLGNACASYGAHVDDSVQYQVYNDIEKNERSIQAVDETAGQVVMQGEEVVETFYYSTSFGYTSTDSLWSSAFESGNDYLVSAMTDEERTTLDMTDEEVFCGFLEEYDEELYEADEGWFRWETSVSLEQIGRNIDDVVKKRQQANPGSILVEKDGKFVKEEVETIGSVKSVKIQKRNEAGAVVQVLIKGSDQNIQVKTEYNVRAILAPNGAEIVKNDETSTPGTALLPSGYFYLEAQEDDEELFGYRIYGGGYGHGVGMSQNGAKKLAEAEKNCEEILLYYFTNVEIKNLYEEN